MKRLQRMLPLVAGFILAACGHKPAVQEQRPAPVSGADSIAQIDGDLSFLDIHVGEVFDKAAWAKAHGVNCVEDGPESQREYYHMYKCYYMSRRLDLEIRTLGDNTVYQIDVLRMNGLDDDIWDSCHQVYGEKNIQPARHDSYSRRVDTWKYKNQTITMTRNSDFGSQWMSIQFLDNRLKEEMRETYRKAKEAGKIL